MRLTRTNRGTGCVGTLQRRTEELGLERVVIGHRDIIDDALGPTPDRVAAGLAAQSHGVKCIKFLLIQEKVGN